MFIVEEFWNLLCSRVYHLKGCKLLLVAQYWDWEMGTLYLHVLFQMQQKWLHIKFINILQQFPLSNYVHQIKPCDEEKWIFCNQSNPGHETTLVYPVLRDQTMISCNGAQTCNQRQRQWITGTNCGSICLQLTLIDTSTASVKTTIL